MARENLCWIRRNDVGVDAAAAAEDFPDLLGARGRDKIRAVLDRTGAACPEDGR